jgi:ferric-dicitrate binding protein FerR (iron transport regulator)
LKCTEEDALEHIAKRLSSLNDETTYSRTLVQVNDAVRGNSLLAPDATGEPAILAAGHKVVVAAEPIAAVPVVAVSADETARLLAWRPQMLEFDSTPLAEVVMAFNRKSHVQLVIGDPQLCDLPIVASFRTDNTEGFVRLLEMTAGIRAERSGDTITLRKNR